MKSAKVRSVRVLAADPPIVMSGIRTLCIGAALAALLSGSALADCPATPIADPNDLLISFLASNHTQAAPASLFDTPVKEGMLVYDDTSDALKICNGTVWQTINVGASGSTTLSGLSDVDASAAANGKVLAYNSTTSKWEAVTPSGATPAGTVAGAVQFRGTTAVLAADDANLIWDNTNKRLDAAWLRTHGYASNLLAKYLGSGWLEQPARRLYTRPRGRLGWQQVVISLQTLLGHDLVVGGRTALELHGHAHYLKQATSTVYLFGPDPPPTWLATLDIGVDFRYRNDRKLFDKHRASTAPHELVAEPGMAGKSVGVAAQPWGTWNWPLMVSVPERAVLEMLYELPEHESFHNADMVMEGLTTLSPAKLQALLADCRNVKVKRLFFFLADRHGHAWLKRLDRTAIDLGRGKRMLVKGGRYEPRYMITVPGDLDGVH